jgi:hypothetical protein
MTPEELGWTIPSQKHVGEVAEYAGVAVFLTTILTGVLFFQDV